MPDNPTTPDDSLTGCADDQSELGGAIGRLIENAAPPLATMVDWWVGRDNKDRPIVTIRMGKDEARLWAAWLFDRQEANDASR